MLGHPVERREFQRVLLVGYAVAGVALAAVWLAVRFSERESAFFTREPASALGGEWYAGILSNVNALVWAVGAVATLLTWLVLRRVDPPGAQPFLWAGVITTVLLCDDLFIIHNGLLYDLGVWEGFVYAVYAAGIVWFVARFRSFLGSEGLLVLAVAGVLFGVSLFFDQALPGHNLKEDGAKLLAVVTWSSLLVTMSLRALAPESVRSAVKQSTNQPPRADRLPGR